MSELNSIELKRKMKEAKQRWDAEQAKHDKTVKQYDENPEEFIGSLAACDNDGIRNRVIEYNRGNYCSNKAVNKAKGQFFKFQRLYRKALNQEKKQADNNPVLPANFQLG